MQIAMFQSQLYAEMEMKQKGEDTEKEILYIPKIKTKKLNIRCQHNPNFDFFPWVA
jgi:hypothetical protein